MTTQNDGQSDLNDALSATTKAIGIIVPVLLIVLLLVVLLIAWLH
jgi:hypothetical protein